MIVSIYNPDRLLEVFGTTDPDMAQRSEYFGDLWEQWRGSEVTLRPDKVIDKHLDRKYNRSIYQVMSEAGYDQGFDYQKRAYMARFASPEVQAVFMLYHGDLIK